MEIKSNGAPSPIEGPGLRRWVAQNEAFLRVLFSIALYSSLILCLMSVMLLGAGRLETQLLGAVAVISICAIFAIKWSSKSLRAPRAPNEPHA